MKIIQPLTITDVMLGFMSLPEADHAVWNVATAYSIGNRVIVTTGAHKVYECLVAHTGFNPTIDTTGKWLTVGATNRWKVFDRLISDQAVGAGLVEYNITPGSSQPVVALFGLEAATVQIRVTDASGAALYLKTISLVNNAAVTDWWAYFFSPVIYDTEAVFSNLPVYTGSTLRIRINSNGTTKVGQIIMGALFDLGVIDAGVRLGIVDYSRKEVDEFGRATLVKRAYSQTAEFDFHFPGTSTRQVLRILANLRSTPCVFWAGPDTEDFGTTIYGYYTDFTPTVQGEFITFATLQVEGLI